MIKLSAIIIAKNEEEMIADCIDSLSFCDEILVIDNGSTDRTAEIAQHLKTTVIAASDKTIPQLRNLGKDKAKGKWILYVDADERVSRELHVEIERVVDQKLTASAYRIQRKNYYYGNVEWPVTEKLERVFKKADLIEWTGNLHETAQVKGAIEDLDGFLVHYTHRDLHSMVEKTNEWSEIEAKLRMDASHPKMASWRFMSVMGKTFFRYFVIEKGYKAGIAGLIESMYQAFSIFITYAKLWELQQKNEKN